MDIATHHFNENVSYDELEIISKRGWGHENWFQNELLIALNRNGVCTKTLTKNGLDADLVLKNNGNKVGLELRTTVKGRTPRLIDSLVHHMNAEYYMFLTEISERAKTKEKLCSALTEFKKRYNEIHGGFWMLMVLKNNKNGLKKRRAEWNRKRKQSKANRQ